MKPTAEQTAILVALLMKRAGGKRARISEKTVKILSKRKHLRTAFIEVLSRELDDLGLHLVEIERGGWGIIYFSALDGAPAITARKYLADDLKRIRHEGEQFDFSQLKREVDEYMDNDDEGDE